MQTTNLLLQAGNEVLKIAPQDVSTIAPLRCDLGIALHDVLLLRTHETRCEIVASCRLTAAMFTESVRASVSRACNGAH